MRRWQACAGSTSEIRCRRTLCAMFAILLSSLHEPEANEWASRALALDPDAFLSIFSSQIAAAASGDWPRTLAASEALFSVGYPG